MTATYTFGRFRLDAGAEILFRETEPLPVGKRAVALLRALVEQPGAPVSKDALIRAAWPGLAVEESNLTVQIAALRRVFGKEPGGERWIETLSRRGYRFMGPVVTRLQEAVAGAHVLALPDRPSIAVLPFTNMSSDPEQEYFADGIVDEIITALSRIRWLFVIARNSSFTYKGRAVDVKQVGRELGVRYVLEGSVRKAGQQVRITGQLIDTSTGMHLWGDRFDGQIEDIFNLQDQVTDSVVGAIAPKLQQAEVERSRRKKPEYLNAWDYYLRGLWHFHQVSDEHTDGALDCFRRAVELDQNFAEAHVGIARTLFSQIVYQFRSERELNIRLACEGASRALALDNENTNGYYILAIASAHAGDVEAAVRLASNAVDLNPNSAPGHFAVAIATLFAGRPTEALIAVDAALRLSPNDPQKFAWLALRGSALYLLKRYDEAIVVAEHSCAIHWFHTACRVLAASYAQLGMLDRAHAALYELLANPHAEKTITEVIRPFKRVADRDHYTEGLRKAGMPE